MTQARGSVPIDGVAMTAVGVAVIRARESERPDRLYDDPLAREFVEAARAGFAETEGGVDRWSRIEAVADAFYTGRSVAVRLVDDAVRAGIESGCRQVVLIGAGLDTRAFRMPLPAGTRWFEIDLPELFAFKEPVLAAAGAVPGCVRAVIAQDLRGDWAKPLREQGFRPDEPTQWVDEGAIPYLLHEDALRVVTTITELSAPGSRFGVARLKVDPNQPHYRELAELVGGDPEWTPHGLGPGAEDWLREHGWRTEFRGWDEMVAELDRPAALNDPDVGTVLAIRE
ncbi:MULTISPECIES: SAM-dependent methyltransferase [unclassified Nocardia]|uniref:SAM-dependent methyltransferase n=1 Tax=unclassified Nocardia TaxID=2637762 RepID=UPI001CE42305|nr:MULTISPECIES: SAM-dependent methyltransferase [unclassified Nocardia]